jgi:hypothetical protein
MSSVSTAPTFSREQVSIYRINAQTKGGRIGQDTSRCASKHYAEVLKESCGGAGQEPAGKAPLKLHRREDVEEQTRTTIAEHNCFWKHLYWTSKWTSKSKSGQGERSQSCRAQRQFGTRVSRRPRFRLRRCAFIDYLTSISPYW